MTKTYRATPEEWAQVKGYADLGGFSSYSCTFELLHRVQALEAAQQLHTFTADDVAPIRAPITRDRDETGDYLIVHDIPAPAASAAAQPADSLMDRVARAIYDAPNNHDGCWRSEARAALREVAAWMVEQAPEPGPVGKWLGQISTPFAVMADMLRDEANR